VEEGQQEEEASSSSTLSSSSDEEERLLHGIGQGPAVLLHPSAERQAARAAAMSSVGNGGGNSGGNGQEAGAAEAAAQIGASLAQHSGASAPAVAAADQSIILDEAIVAHAATEQEVKEYALWLGMDPDGEDAPLMWIAREGIDSKLPAGWKPCQSPGPEGQVSPNRQSHAAFRDVC